MDNVKSCTRLRSLGMSSKEKKHFKKNRSWDHKEREFLVHSINDAHLTSDSDNMQLTMSSLETASRNSPGSIMVGGFLRAHTLFPSEGQELSFYSQKEAIELYQKKLVQLQQEMAHKDQYVFELEHARKLAEDKATYAIEYASLLDGKQQQELNTLQSNFESRVNEQVFILKQQAEAKLNDAKKHFQQIQTTIKHKLQETEYALLHVRDENAQLNSAKNKMEAELAQSLNHIAKMKQIIETERTYRLMLESNIKAKMEHYEDLKKAAAAYSVYKRGMEDKITELSSYIQTIQMQKLAAERDRTNITSELSTTKSALEDLKTNLDFEIKLRKKYENKFNEDLQNSQNTEQTNQQQTDDQEAIAAARKTLEELIFVEIEKPGEEIEYTDISKAARPKERSKLYSLS